jgi:HSP20 family molecular chaperone IbpA
VEATRDTRPPLDPLREALERVERVGDPAMASPHDRWEPELWFDDGDGFLTIRVSLPGTRPDDVRVRVADDLLTVEADRRHDEDRQGQGFVRSFLLPSPVAADAVDAALSDGTLTVTVDKRTARRGRRIPLA